MLGSLWVPLTQSLTLSLPACLGAVFKNPKAQEFVTFSTASMQSENNPKCPWGVQQEMALSAL